MRPRHAILAAVLAFLLVNILPLGLRPVVSPDETRYGSIALGMVESGDWLSMRMSGFRFYEKPAFGYWMMAASIEAFGANAFAIRLPAALCGGLAALSIGIAARRGARLAGASADDATVTGALVALGTLTMILSAVGSSVANLDQPIAGLVIASGSLFFLGATEPPGGRRWAWLVAAGFAAGLGFMTKGLLAFAFPAVTVVPWLLWERRWREAFLLPLVPVAVAAIVALPWAIAVHRTEPGFWERFIVHEHFQRFTGTAHEQPHESWAFYLLVLGIGCIPWLASLPLAARRWPSLARTSTAFRFAACATLGPLLFLSASRGKLPSYALPLIPPIAWLIVSGLQQAFAARADSARSRVPGGILMILALVATGLALAGEASRPLLSLVWSDAPHLRAGLVAVAFFLWGLGDWHAQRARTGAARIAWMGLSPVVPLASFSLLVPLAAIPETDFPGRSIERERAVIAAAPTLLCDYKMAHACAWFIHRTDFLLVGDMREFDNGLGIPEEESRRVSDGELPAAVSAALGKGPVVMAVESSRLEPLLSLPGMPAAARRSPHRGWTLVTFEPGPAPVASDGGQGR